jgi:GNAT superfamily N-acetyltransferase
MATDSSLNSELSINTVADFYRDLLLRDGTTVRLRSLRHSDKGKLIALFRRCSPESIRYRFLSTIKSLPKEMLERLLTVDGAKQVALVVVQGEGADERIVAVGRYNVELARPQVAEVAFLVEDAFQKRGIGTLLLDHLVEVARQHGITHFSADVLVDNHVMLSVFRKAGYALTSSASYGVTHLEFPITETDVARGRAEAQEAEAQGAAKK